MIQIKEMIPMEFDALPRRFNGIFLIETNLHQAIFPRNGFQKSLGGLCRDRNSGKNAQLLHKKRLAKVVDKVFPLMRYRHNSQILIPFHLHQSIPSRMDNVQVPRPGINQAVGSLRNAMVPQGFIDLFMGQVGDHRQFSRILRYISGHPAQRFSPPRVSLWVK